MDCSVAASQWLSQLVEALDVPFMRCLLDAFVYNVSWSIKVILLNYGGLRSHRQATPIFMGLILGDFIMGVMWGLIGLSTGMTTYQF